MIILEPSSLFYSVMLFLHSLDHESGPKLLLSGCHIMMHSFIFMLHYLLALTGQFLLTKYIGELQLELYISPGEWRNQVEGSHTLLFLKDCVDSMFRNLVQGGLIIRHGLLLLI